MLDAVISIKFLDKKVKKRVKIYKVPKMVNIHKEHHH